MNAIVFEHVKVEELPEAWRAKLAKPLGARVTVRIEEEASHQESVATDIKTDKPIKDPAFGIWRDREDMADVEAYLRKIRAPRYNRDGTHNDG
ncbi:MAG: hypothetical protein ACREVR_03430 [Burkholderiales bacterium]